MKIGIDKFAMAAAWIAIVAIAYATLTHVGFAYGLYYKLAPYMMHPAMRTYAHFEHIFAFFVLGALFALAYPRRPILVCCMVFGAALGLEFLQTITPDRHGTFIDALEKIAGGAAGILLARIVQKRRAESNRAG
jgi:hypothetical protein